MSLTKDNLAAIETVVVNSINQAVDHIVIPRFDELDQQVDGLRVTLNDHGIVLDEHTRILNEHSNRLRLLTDKVDDSSGKLQAIEADIRELYVLIKAPSNLGPSKSFTKLPTNKKILALHAEVTALAKQFGVVLPKN